MTEIGLVLESILDEYPDELFLIEGHTDAVGSDYANLLLSDRRAEAVAVMLSSNFDIPPKNLVTQAARAAPRFSLRTAALAGMVRASTNIPFKEHWMASGSFLSELSDGPTASHIGRLSESDVVRVDGHDLPFPAPPFMNYRQETAVHISSGKRDFSLLGEIVDTHAIDQPILDFACANGRTLRWFGERAQRQEIWGVDIDAKRIGWCQNWLSPPFHFSMVTTTPHLPFEDRYFGFIYGYSIFTHLDELFMAWLCEMRRCLQVGGLLFVTICDEDSFARQLETESAVKRFATNDPNTARFLEPDTLISFKRFNKTIFTHIKRDYFVKVCQPHLELVRVVPGAMAVQTGLLLKRVK